ncbi:MAG: hypothetical protein ABI723_10675 [Bacteroidia bacterium]
MSNYLSGIVARNIPDNAPSLRPATPLMSTPHSDPFEQTINDQPAFNSLQQTDSPFNQTNEPPQNIIKPVVQKEFKNNIESPIQNKSFDIPYITKHIERLEFIESKEQKEPIATKDAFTSFIPPVKTDLIKSNNEEVIEVPVNSSIEPRNKKDKGEQKKESINIEPVFMEQKPMSSIKNPLITPPFKNDKSKKIAPVKNTSNVARLNPVQRSVQHSAPLPKINTKNNEPAPKLVIGKIIVEIVQPEKPAPPKVVNRIIQAPSALNSSKTNNLSFGLGQL